MTYLAYTNKGKIKQQMLRKEFQMFKYFQLEYTLVSVAEYENPLQVYTPHFHINNNTYYKSADLIFCIQINALREGTYKEARNCFSKNEITLQPSISTSLTSQLHQHFCELFPSQTFQKGRTTIVDKEYMILIIRISEL